MIFRINRNYDEGGGGDTATQTENFSDVPATKEGLETLMMRSFNKSNESQPPEGSQPATGGSKQQEPAAQAKAEGDNSAPILPKDQGTTAGLGKETTDDGKGAATKWSEEQLKVLEAKGWKEIPFNSETQKVVESFREAESQLSRLTSSNTNYASLVDNIKAAAKSNDINALKRLGVNTDLSFNSIDDQIKGFENQWDSIVDAINPIYSQFTPEAKALLEDALTPLQQNINQKTYELQRQKEKMDLRNDLASEFGQADPYKAKQEHAEKVFTELAVDNKQVFDNINKHLKPYTEQGAVLKELYGIDLAGLGANSEAAKMWANIADALETKQNLPQLIEAEIKKREEENVQKPAKVVTGSGAPVGQNAGPSFRDQMLARRKMRSGY